MKAVWYRVTVEEPRLRMRAAAASMERAFRRWAVPVGWAALLTLLAIAFRSSGEDGQFFFTLAGIAAGILIVDCAIQCWYAVTGALKDRWHERAPSGYLRTHTAPPMIRVVGVLIAAIVGLGLFYLVRSHTFSSENLMAAIAKAERSLQEASEARR